MRIQIGNKFSVILVVMAAASLVSMLATLYIDHIVNHDLYNYGLQFNTSWAVPYWTMAAIVFSMGWLIIATSVAFELQLVVRRLHRNPEPEAPLVNEQRVQNETANNEANQSDISEEEEVETTALAVKTDDELNEFRVIVEEVSETEDATVARQETDGEPANEQ